LLIEEDGTIKEILTRNIEEGTPTMLWGKSGVGKTRRIEEIDPEYTSIILRDGMLPEEVVGGKEPNGEPGMVYPPEWYKLLCEKCKDGKQHVLFIDELTNVKDTTKTLVWDIIGQRCVSGNRWPLPSNSVVVAAGNRAEESSAVRTDVNGNELPEPLRRRFVSHIEIPLDMATWQEWALETNSGTGKLNIHPSILSFCISHGNECMYSEYDKEMNGIEPPLDPRRWEYVSRTVYAAEERGAIPSKERLEKMIGRDLAASVFDMLQRPKIKMELVEAGKYQAEHFPNIDNKLFALGEVLRSSTNNERAVQEFVEGCLGEDMGVIYEVMKTQRKGALDKLNSRKGIEGQGFDR